MRILVVDDEPMLRQLLQEELEYKGYQVTTAENAEEGWLTFQADGRFDVVLTDIRMNGQSGLDLLKRIRKHNPHEPRVYLVSGFSDITEADAQAMGASGILHKPYAMTQLMTLLESKISRD